jgi:hypothetical protein
MASKKTAAKNANKSAFVRALPATMPAKEAVEKAKAAGITLDAKYVYNIRASARTASKTNRVVKSETRATKASSSPSSNGIERIFINAALELGLARAGEILENVRAKLKTMTL